MTAHAHATTHGFAPELVEQALAHALALPAKVPVLGIAGLQGSGKSTLAAQVAALGVARGLRVAVLSIDDFYLGRDARNALAREVHPLLATRGPPSTHDLPLALQTLAKLRAGEATPLPRFDKLADDRLPPSQWPQAPAPCDLVVFEGWCLCTPAQDDAQLAGPINALERDEDADGRWRRHCNDALRRDYPALWRCIDALWFLQGPGFEVVPQWRWEQESALQATDPARTAMSRAQVGRFVEFFERVSRQALRTLPSLAARTVVLDARRRPGG